MASAGFNRAMRFYEMLRSMRTNSAIRLTPLAALFLGAAAASSLAASEPVAWGDWSVPVNGLKGRLLVAYEGESNSPPSRAMVHLELRNVASLGHPVEVLYATRGESCPLRSDLIDAKNEQARKEIVSITGGDPAPDWLVLPEGATLRLPVGWVSAGGTQRSGFFIGVIPHKAWRIPEDSDALYSLSGEFEITPPRDTSDHPYAWQGVLALPKVGISSKPPAGPRGIEEPQPITTGEWSERTNGLRGRLLFCGYSRSNNLPDKAAIFLQLDTQTKWGNSLGIYYGTCYMDCPLHWELSDASGQPVPRAGSPRELPSAWSGWGYRCLSISVPSKQTPGGRIDYPAGATISQQPSYWLMLPQGSVLTLPVTLEAMIACSARLQVIALAPEDIWLVPETQKEDYLLTGTFQVPPRLELGHLFFWQGVLKLPKLRIPPQNP